MRRLLALGLLLPACACTSDFLLDAAPAPDARTIIYFAQRDDVILSALVVSPTHQAPVAELKVREAADLVLTAMAYAKTPDELGLPEGALLEDPAGRTLPSPDVVYQAAASNGVWERRSEPPSAVQAFRSAAQAAARCAMPSVRNVPLPEIRRGFNFTGFSPSPKVAVLYFSERQALTLRADLSVVLSALPAESPSYVTASGTTAVGLLASRCLAKLSVDEQGQVSSHLWFCGPRWLGALPGEDGSFALVAPENVVVVDRQSREVSRIAVEAENIPFFRAVLVGEEVFGVQDSESTVTRLSPRGLAREQVNGHGEFITALRVIRGRVYAAGSAGSVFERRSVGAWLDLGKSGIGDVDEIVATPRGFLAIGGVGEVTEYIDGHGWCPTQQLASDDSTVVLRLGSGYLFYTKGLVRRTPSLTWADFGLEP